MVPGSDDNALDAYLAERRAAVDEALVACLDDCFSYPVAKDDDLLYQAMKYSLTSGGKRLRPILCLTAAELADADYRRYLFAACAIEFVHTYSLIHDDLPAMDDDDFRRGWPTCHKVFGEPVAILAGDALLTEAFRLIASGGAAAGIGPELLRTTIEDIGRAAGASGLIHGQVLDVLSESVTVPPSLLREIHLNKTARLLAAALVTGGRLAGLDSTVLSALNRCGTAIGHAFQIVDDILNVEGDRKLLGKETGTDARRRKATYPAVFGVDESRRRARDLSDEAVAALAGLGPEADRLRGLARQLVGRRV